MQVLFYHINLKTISEIFCFNCLFLNMQMALSTLSSGDYLNWKIINTLLIKSMDTEREISFIIKQITNDIIEEYRCELGNEQKSLINFLV